MKRTNRFGYEVTILEDTLSPQSGKRITTFQLRYPRFVHAELLTHRQLSRNSSSSRAIPVKKMIENVEKYPARPVHWGSNNPGMQSKSKMEDRQAKRAEKVWLASAKVACNFAKLLSKMGAHKQIVNRITEPYQFIDVVVTATEWDNFFKLRDHDDAQPEIRELARMMREEMKESKPKHDKYHLPYVSDEERDKHGLIQLLAMSVARCARVSYRNHDKSNPSVEKDINLAKMLITEGHMSPTEHQAFSGPPEDEQYGNFLGFVQFRHSPALKQILNLEEKGA